MPLQHPAGLLAAEQRSLHQPLPWAALVQGDMGREAVTAATAAASAISDPVRVARALDDALAQTSYPEAIGWVPYGIASGDAGLAVMAGYLDACQPGHGWDQAAHAMLTRAVDAARDAGGRGISLFSGLTSVAFAAWCLSRGGGRYRRLLAQLDDIVLRHTETAAEHLVRHQAPGISVSAFDLISGLAGAGAYALVRRDEPHAADALDAVLSAFVRLIRQTGALPAWYTPAHLAGNPDMRQAFPEGTLNLGLAHGIPGPVALMALATQAGHDVPGLRAALAEGADWIAGHRADDQWGINWPSVIGVSGGAPDTTSRPGRAAWCYGTPGVARALWHAGAALDRASLQDLAADAMMAVYRRPIAARAIDSPTFCHGVAGLLQITLRFANDTGDAAFIDAARGLAGQLLEAYNATAVVPFQSVEPDGRQVDQPGLLDGVAGVALVLLAAACPVEPAWDRLFLLS